MNDSSMLPLDIILTHILPHLDGVTLITLSSVSSEFFNLIRKNNNEDLWKKICIATWPSLLSNGSLWLSEMISMFPGGDYRSFFFDAFPSIHHRHIPRPRVVFYHHVGSHVFMDSFFVTGVDPKSPPLPPVANFTYAVDIFLQGERVREPLYTNIQYQRINLQGSLQGRSPVGNNYFELRASNSVNSNLNFIPIKKDGCEEYLKEKLRLSCVLISSRYSRYDPAPYRKRAWGLFSSSCNPISVTTNKKRVEAVYETVMPKLSHYCNCSYTEMVKFKVMVKCGWEGGEEDKFYVKCIEFRMEDMNGIHLLKEDAAIFLLHAIEFGERKKK